MSAASLLPNLEDRTQEDTLPNKAMGPKQAWDVAKDVRTQSSGNLDQNRATFFSLSEVLCLATPSTIEPEEREFVVDSGASTDMLSKQDLKLN